MNDFLIGPAWWLLALLVEVDHLDPPFMFTHWEEYNKNKYCVKNVYVYSLWFADYLPCFKVCMAKYTEVHYNAKTS